LEPIDLFEIFIVSHYSPTFWLNPHLFRDAFLASSMTRTSPLALQIQ